MSEWQPIATAPKGARDPVRILMATAGEPKSIHTGYFDPYYAPGGSGYNGGDGWTIDAAGEQYRLHHNGPTHWMPLPPIPAASKPIAAEGQP